MAEASITRQGVDARLPLSALLVILLVTLLYVLYRIALPKPIPGIPYNKDSSMSIWGDLPALQAHRKRTGRTRDWMVQQNVKHDSPLVQIFLSPLSKPFVLISDFRESQDILLRRTAEFDRSSRNAELFSGILPNHHIAMKTSDPRFAANKDLIKDLMTPAFLNQVSAPEIYTKALHLVDLWTLKSQRAEGRPFEAGQDISWAALDVIGAAAFGIEDDRSLTKMQLDALDQACPTAHPNRQSDAFHFQPIALPSETEAVVDLAASMGKAVGSPQPWLVNFINLNRPHLRRAWRLKEQMVEGEIQSSLGRLEAEEPIRCALDYILRREKNAASKTGRTPMYRSREVIDELFGYLVAGHETTATTLAWASKLLADNPAPQQKLRDTMRSAYGTAAKERRHPTADEITKTSLPYLDAFIEEVNRQSAVVPLLLRQASVDATVLGAKIPKGTTVFFMCNGPGFKTPGMPVDESLRHESSRRAKIQRGTWDPADVAEFAPERWLTTRGDGEVVFDANAGPMLGFGSGPRGCCGRRLAYLELRLVIALLVWNFEFNAVPASLSSYDATDSLTTTPNQCFVSLRKLR